MRAGGSARADASAERVRIVNWVLLVEDDLDHRLLIREVVSRMFSGVELHEAGDAASAIAWVRDRAKVKGGLAHGVVVLDLGLPGPSGFHFLEWVREHDVLDPLPVVVLTASENPMDAEHAFHLGAKGYFQKPADFRAYIAIFERALSLAAPGDGPPSSDGPAPGTG